MSICCLDVLYNGAEDRLVDTDIGWTRFKFGLPYSYQSEGNRHIRPIPSRLSISTVEWELIGIQTFLR